MVNMETRILRLFLCASAVFLKEPLIPAAYNPLACRQVFTNMRIATGPLEDLVKAATKYQQTLEAAALSGQAFADTLAKVRLVSRYHSVQCHPDTLIVCAPISLRIYRGALPAFETRLTQTMHLICQLFYFLHGLPLQVAVMAGNARGATVDLGQSFQKLVARHKAVRSLSSSTAVCILISTPIYIMCT